MEYSVALTVNSALAPVGLSSAQLAALPASCGFVIVSAPDTNPNAGPVYVSVAGAAPTQANALRGAPVEPSNYEGIKVYGNPAQLWFATNATNPVVLIRVVV